MNDAACRIFGYDEGTLTGRSVETLVPESARGAHRGHRESYIEGAATPRPMGIGLELAGRRQDGSTFPAEISLSPLPDEVGGGAIATVRDVSLRRRLRDFGAGALRAAEDVRKLIARELHDETAQELSALMIHLRLLRNAADDEEREARTETLRDGLQGAIEGIRRIARGLRPPELEDAGLTAALRAHVRQLEEARELEVDMEAEEVDAHLTKDGLLVLYRVVQEALTNVARHAGVKEARVRVRREGTRVTAEIVDRGRGFRVERMDREGLGLLGMHERASMVGGDLTILTAPGEGTTVRLSLPSDPLPDSPGRTENARV